MTARACITKEAKGLSFFERYLTGWVALCMVVGIALGRFAPGVARYLDGLAIYIDGAPVVSIPIAICLFFMMYPIMVKIDFQEVVKAGRSAKPVGLTLVLNWAIKPFTMYAIAILFLGVFFRGFIGADAVDLVKMPLGSDLDVGAVYGAGKVVLHDGVRMLEVPLWRSYLAGCILLGIAPCTAMVLVWGYLAKGNDGHTLIMVAINSLTMLVLYGVLGGFLLGVGRLPVPWQALLLSVGIYVALPLVAGFFSRKGIVRAKGEEWFREKFLNVLTPVTIAALLITLVLLFSFKGDVILANPLTYPVDRHTSLHSDQPHLLARLLGRPLDEAVVRGRGAVGDDRRVEPLRGRHRDGCHALRALVRCGARDRGGRAHRGAGDVDARQDLSADDGVVRSRK